MESTGSKSYCHICETVYPVHTHICHRNNECEKHYMQKHGQLDCEVCNETFPTFKKFLNHFISGRHKVCFAGKGTHYYCTVCNHFGKHRENHVKSKKHIRRNGQDHHLLPLTGTTSIIPEFSHIREERYCKICDQPCIKKEFVKDHVETKIHKARVNNFKDYKLCKKAEDAQRQRKEEKEQEEIERVEQNYIS